MLLLQPFLLDPRILRRLLRYRRLLLQSHCLLALFLFLDHLVHLELHFFSLLPGLPLGFLALAFQRLFQFLFLLGALGLQGFLGRQLLLLLQFRGLRLVLALLLIVKVLQERQFLLEPMHSDAKRHQVTVNIDGFLNLLLLLEGVAQGQIRVHVLPVVLDGALQSSNRLRVIANEVVQHTSVVLED